MLNISYINQQIAQCVLWMTEGHRPTAIRRVSFPKYQVLAPLRRTINVWYQSYVENGSHANRGRNGRPTISYKKENQMAEMSISDPRRSRREVAVIVGLHQTAVCHFLRQKMKLSPYHLYLGQKLSETDMKNRAQFVLLCRQKLQEDPNFFKRIVFSDAWIYSLHGVANKQTYSI